jgi:hypothetical protein
VEKTIGQPVVSEGFVATIRRMFNGALFFGDNCKKTDLSAQQHLAENCSTQKSI